MQRGIFRRGSHPQLLIAMILPIHILRKHFLTITMGYKFKRSQENINYLMYVDDIKILGKKKEQETGTNSKNIKPGYRNGIWHRNMCHPNYEKK